MADQVAPSTMGEAAQDPAVNGGDPGDDAMLTHQISGVFTPLPAYHGRMISWVGATLIVIGFLAGGIGLIVGPTWWLFWVGAGITVVGGLIGLASNIMDDWY
jgi:hypothetical protein